MKIIKCWLTRHHWLLQEERPTNQGFYYTYFYKCTVCGKSIKQSVYNLDEELRTPPQQSNRAKKK